MNVKAFFKLLTSFTLIFFLLVMSCFVAYVTTSGGSFFGYEFNSVEQTPCINVLMMGLDKDGTRTDVLILAQLNMIDGKINMLQIPRDTYMPNNGRSDKKINSAYGLNKEKSTIKEVSDLLDVQIDKYVTIDISGFRDLIDTIGGVDFYVPQDMDYDDPTQDLHIHLKEGQQHLDGDKAEQLVRFRGYANGDLDRMKVQSDFIQATIDEIFQIANVGKIDDMVEDFSKLVKTDFTFNEMLTYAPYVLSLDRNKINTHQLVNEPRYINNISYVIPDYEANAKIIEEHFTPSVVEEVSALDIETNIIGNGTYVVTGNAKPSKSIFNRFTSVDIIDASNGSADVIAIKDDLKKYGYNVMKITTAKELNYEKTVVVSVSKDSNAADIAKIVGLSEYVYNPQKAEGSDITIILGKNQKGD